MSTFETGAELPPQTYTVTRADLVRYAGASGDLNPIHWSDRVASIGRPARRDRPRHVHHGAGRPRRSTPGPAAPGRCVELGCKFTKPVVVPDDDDGVEVVVAGTVKNVDRRREHGRARR